MGWSVGGDAGFDVQTVQREDQQRPSLTTAGKTNSSIMSASTGNLAECTDHDYVYNNNYIL